VRTVPPKRGSVEDEGNLDDVPVRIRISEQNSAIRAQATDSHSSALGRSPRDTIHLSLAPVHPHLGLLPALQIHRARERLGHIPRRVDKKVVGEQTGHRRLNEVGLGRMDAVEGCEVFGTERGVEMGGEVCEVGFERGGRVEL
jgi:hypothetical protein